MPESNSHIAEMLSQLTDLNDLVLKRTRAVYVPLGADYGITVHWNPDAMDPVVYAKLQALKDQDDPFAVADSLIAPLLVRWELTSGGSSVPMVKGGEQFPPTAENVSSLGLLIVKLIATAINDDFGRAASAEGLKEVKDESGAPS